MNNKNLPQQTSYQILNKQNLDPQILFKIKQITTGVQRIQDINRPNIIKQINHICFPNLTNLNLRSCEISNIQGIQYLNLPVLLTLELYGNNIRSLKPLLKNHSMKKLKTLTFYRNPIKTSWSVQRQFLPRLSDYQLDSKAISTIQNISFLSKNQYYPIQKLYDNFPHRIKQKKVKNKLLGKQPFNKLK